MAETRIEKYREYRRSIISGDAPILKTQIETSLKTTSKESLTSVNEQEAVFLKKIHRKSLMGTLSYLFFVLLIVTPLVVFGIILF